MGSPLGEVGRHELEVQHTVTLTRDFWLKVTEVTQREWRYLMHTNPSYFYSCGEDCPVEQVSWWDAVAYTNALSASQGLVPCYTDFVGCEGTPGDGNYACTSVVFDGLGCAGYRLPTEAEWEYAARAGTSTATYNGNITVSYDVDPVMEPIVWYSDNSSNSPHPVGLKQANAWGLYDMLGNVGEWTYDWWVSDWYFGAYEGTGTDPTGPPSALYRVYRGGSGNDDARYTRAATRHWLPPALRANWVGFRPARSIP